MPASRGAAYHPAMGGPEGPVRSTEATSRAAPDRLAPAAWFVVSFLAYVACGLVVHTFVLNWIVGPTWLLVTLWVLPSAWHRLQRAVLR
jgi:hypothetical protein